MPGEEQVGGQMELGRFAGECAGKGMPLGKRVLT